MKKTFKELNTVNVKCDQCNEVHECIGTTSYKDASIETKPLGWICVKLNDEFYDFCCKDCLYNFKEENSLC